MLGMETTRLIGVSPPQELEIDEYRFDRHWRSENRAGEWRSGGAEERWSGGMQQN
jgi:hypothetical protein